MRRTLRVLRGSSAIDDDGGDRRLLARASRPFLKGFTALGETPAPSRFPERSGHLLPRSRRQAALFRRAGANAGRQALSRGAGKRRPPTSRCRQKVRADGGRLRQAAGKFATTGILWDCRMSRRRPKKDSMGMDYIAVYEGDEDDGSVRQD